MKINRDSWHYKVWRWTYDAGCYPDQTNLCSYVQSIFWITLGRCLMYGLLAAAILTLVAVIVAAEYMGWKEHTTWMAIGHGSVVLVVALLALYAFWESGSYKREREPTLIGKWLSAKKQGICPLITFED